MSNNKLSLTNLNLKKGDLEEKILAKLFDRKSKSRSNSSIRADADQGDNPKKDNLTHGEKESRIKALLNLKTAAAEEKAAQRPLPSKYTVITAPEDKPSAKVKAEERVAVKVTNTVEAPKPEKGAEKRDFTDKKVNTDFKRKKYSKHNKSVTHDHTSTYNAKKSRSVVVKDLKKPLVRKIRIKSPMTIHEISSKVFESKEKVIRCIKNFDESIDITKPIEVDVLELIVQELGHVPELKVKKSLSKLLAEGQENTELLEKRAPIVTVMGHVDHGKTTLIDALRDSSIVNTEHGGITQHIGAYQIGNSIDDLVTVIDTPGHEAFTAMRARGAKVTDIAVLVIAADDSIKEQTVEAIKHVQAAQVPIVVAVNKIDQPDANVQRVVNELLQYNIVAEEVGGDVLVVPLSAKKRLNLDKLKEAILLQAELLEIKANPSSKASGVILEARLDKKSGVLATLIVKNGTLKKGSILVSGRSYCKVRLMRDCYGKEIKEALPATPVEVLGFDVVPDSGDNFCVAKDEKEARAIIEMSVHDEKKSVAAGDITSDNLFADEKQVLKFLVKGDTQGSIEAISDAIDKFQIDDVDITLLYKGVGAPTESDILLASASCGSILSFCVRENKKTADLAKKHGVVISHYSIIYNLINDVKSIVSGLLPTIKNEKVIGNAVVRKVFNISKVGKVAGCYVQEGVLRRKVSVRLLRDSKVVYEGSINTLRRLKDDEKEVTNGFECGVSLENYTDVKVGDIIESFEVTESQQSL